MTTRNSVVSPAYFVSGGYNLKSTEEENFAIILKSKIENLC